MDSTVKDGDKRMDLPQGSREFTDAGTNRLFGELLVSKGLLTQEELGEVLDAQKQQGGRLGEILLRMVGDGGGF